MKLREFALYGLTLTVNMSIYVEKMYNESIGRVQAHGFPLSWESPFI